MNALPVRVVLDNTVISSFHLAGALSRIVLLWRTRWIVPLQVRDEAAAWKVHGPTVAATLRQLERDGALEFATPEVGPEGALFVVLQRTRGHGESAAIAIAHHRRFAVAIDDRHARRSCEGLNPPVPTKSTEQLLATAVEDGVLERSEAGRIWAAMGISDPKRGIGL